MYLSLQVARTEEEEPHRSARGGGGQGRSTGQSEEHSRSQRRRQSAIETRHKEVRRWEAGQQTLLASQRSCELVTSREK
eukprot:6132341-Pleurochrysis_carterae.AAC.1